MGQAGEEEEEEREMVDPTSIASRIAITWKWMCGIEIDIPPAMWHSIYKNRKAHQCPEDTVNFIFTRPKASQFILPEILTEEPSSERPKKSGGYKNRTSL
jgi:hypothetical protein